MNSLSPKLVTKCVSPVTNPYHPYKHYVLRIVPFFVTNFLKAFLVSILILFALSPSKALSQPTFPETRINITLPMPSHCHISLALARIVSVYSTTVHSSYRTRILYPRHTLWHKGYKQELAMTVRLHCNATSCSKYRIQNIELNHNIGSIYTYRVKQEAVSVAESAPNSCVLLPCPILSHPVETGNPLIHEKGCYPYTSIAKLESRYPTLISQYESSEPIPMLHTGLFLPRSVTPENHLWRLIPSIVNLFHRYGMRTMLYGNISIHCPAYPEPPALSQLEVSDVTSSYHAQYRLYHAYAIRRLFPLVAVRFITETRRPCLTECSNHAGHREIIFERWKVICLTSHERQSTTVSGPKVRKKKFRNAELSIYTQHYESTYTYRGWRHITKWSAISHGIGWKRANSHTMGVRYG